MAGIKIHGSVISTAAQRVFACLYEKDIDFELVPVDMSAGEHKSEAFLAKNPFGQVPAFEQGDLYLFESRAMTQYIAEQYADKGIALTCPSKTVPMLLVWKEVEAHQFDPVASKLNWEIVFKHTTDPAAVEELEAKLSKELDMHKARLSKSKFDPVGSKLNWELVFKHTTDPAAVEALEAKLSKVLDVYEARLSKSKFFACDCFTLADMHHPPNINLLMGTPVKKHFDSRPHVSPVWAKVLVWIAGTLAQAGLAWLAEITARPACVSKK